MTEVVYIVLLAIPILYIFWLFASEFVEKLVVVKPCALCAAVLSTWLGLLAFTIIGYSVPPIIPAILMGESVSGFAYIVERRVKQKSIIALLKPAIIILGTAVVYVVISIVK